LREPARHARRKTPTASHPAVALAAAAPAEAASQPAGSTSQPEVIPLPQVCLPPSLDDWEVDEQLRHIGRVLAVDELEAPRPDILRIDAAHPRPPAKRHRRPERPRRSRPAAQPAEGQGLLPLLTWFCTLLGTMGITCGGVLLGWSAWTAQQELWRVGVPIALGALAVLAVGLLLQLDQSLQQRRTATHLSAKTTSAGSP
jgi:hypothetical protein